MLFRLPGTEITEPLNTAKKLMKLAILASGTGSTAEPIFKFASIIITNNSNAGIIERAKKYGIDCIVLPRKDYEVYDSPGNLNIEKSREKYGLSMRSLFKMYEVDFISHNGWSLLTPANVVNFFEGRIVNSHPAPLDPSYPDFGGQGMHGLAVHQAVLNFKLMIHRPFEETEVTLHLITGEYDKGDIVAVSGVPILPDDTAETLQQRVKEVEKKQNEVFWDSVDQTGEIKRLQRTNRLIRPEEGLILEEAKRRAVNQFPRG